LARPNFLAKFGAPGVPFSNHPSSSQIKNNNLPTRGGKGLGAMKKQAIGRRGFLKSAGAVGAALGTSSGAATPAKA